MGISRDPPNVRDRSLTIRRDRSGRLDQDRTSTHSDDMDRVTRCGMM